MSLGEALARRLFFPLHERLCGRSTQRQAQSLARLAARSPAQLDGECQSRLRELLTFAASLPFYRARFLRHGVCPAARDARRELERLPALTKAEVRENAAGMIWTRVPGGLQPCVSGGTSGDTLHFFVDRMRQSQSMGARLFMQSLFGVRPGDRRMWLWGSPIELQRSRMRRVRDRLINELVLDAFEMSSDAMDAYLSRMAAYQPRLLIGYSSAVARLAAHAQRRYTPADFPQLRVAVLTADEVTAAQRAVVTRVFGCPVASEYGSREAGLIAHECPHGAMHVISPFVHVEIMNAGRSAAPGEVGAIVCTNLGTRAQPMLRYAIGDVGALGPADCPCGLPLPTLSIRAARVTSFIALPGGRLCSGHLAAYLVRSDPRVCEFRVIQHELTRFEVLLSTERGGAAQAILGIRQRFRACFGPDVRVHCRTLAQIPPDASGKRRPIVSHVATCAERFDIVPTPLPERAIPQLSRENQRSRAPDACRRG